MIRRVQHVEFPEDYNVVLQEHFANLKDNFRNLVTGQSQHEPKHIGHEFTGAIAAVMEERRNQSRYNR